MRGNHLSKMRRKKERGSALITFIVIGAFLLGLTAVTYFTVQRAIQVQGAVRRAVLAYESAQGGLDALFNPDSLDAAERGDTVNLGLTLPHGYTVNAEAYRLFSIPIPGTSLLFAMGYESVGASAARGGVATYILGLSEASGSALAARNRLEALYIKLLGLP